MSNFILAPNKFPSGGGDERLVFIDNGNGTFTMTVATGDGTYPSLASAIVAGSGVLVQGTTAGAGGSNTQLQYNNLGALAGIAGATTDGTITTFATSDIRITNLADAAGLIFLRQDNTLNNYGFGFNANLGPITGSNNIGIGRGAGASITSGTDNIFVGITSGNTISTGAHCIGIGTNALRNIATTSDSTAVGWDALQNDTGGQNCAFGMTAGSTISSGTKNVAIGRAALTTLATGTNNTALGDGAGTLATGTGNVFLGFSAGGAQGAGNNKLFIANTNTATPLIGGDFSAATLTLGDTGGTTHSGTITTVANSLTLANLNTPTGTLKTTPIQGDHEFDGVNSYITNEVTSGRGAIPVEQHFKLTANGGTISTIANFFGATSNISLVANGFYEIDIYLWFLNTTIGTVTWTLTNSAAPTSQNITTESSPIAGNVAPPGTATLLAGQLFNDATAAFAYTSGTLVDATNYYTHIKIILKNGTGTSLKIQATKNVGGTITPGIGSRWYCKRISAANVGSFAA